MNTKPFEQNKKLGRGINLANALEANYEGEWGVTLKPEYFKLIKDAGFNSVRIPIRWSAHISKPYPFLIDDNFFSRIDRAIDQTLKNDLTLIINVHHFIELMHKPDNYRSVYLSIWRQVAERYKDYPNSLFFELLNEPSFRLTPKKWNILFPEVLPVIREKNPDRTLLIGPARWNNFSGLKHLKLPDNEKNTIITFHYYKPFRFTHQGAEWVKFSSLFLGTSWKNSEKQRNKIDKHFKKVFDWSKKNNVPINLGEFGAYYKANTEYRILWTQAVAELADKYRFSRHYWDFCAGFGVYDANTKKWNTTLLKSLLLNVIN